MKITIEIECDNAAFGESPEGAAIEARRIVRDALTLGLADAIRHVRASSLPEEYPLPRDINGNRVGRVVVTP